MAEGTHHGDHAQQVIALAKRQLESLLREQSILRKKVKQVKRTVDGLNALFQVEAKAIEFLEPGDIAPASRPLTRLPPEIYSPRKVRARGKKASRGPVHPNLERACRIALLESADGATAAEIYDRIVRRGSYRMKRYKHPLVQVIQALDQLARRDQAKLIAGSDCKRWAWNLPNQEGDSSNFSDHQISVL